MTYKLWCLVEICLACCASFWPECLRADTAGSCFTGAIHTCPSEGSSDLLSNALLGGRWSCTEWHSFEDLKQQGGSKIYSTGATILAFSPLFRMAEKEWIFVKTRVWLVSGKLKVPGLLCSSLGLSVRGPHPVPHFDSARLVDRGPPPGPWQSAGTHRHPPRPPPTQSHRGGLELPWDAVAALTRGEHAAYAMTQAETAPYRQIREIWCERQIRKCNRKQIWEQRIINVATN